MNPIREFLHVHWHTQVCNRAVGWNWDDPDHGITSKLEDIAVWVCDTLSGARAECQIKPGKMCRHDDCWTKYKSELESTWRN